ncbi:CpXC domain-containing protein [Ruminococcaceae bacterium OttesenSCG-928-A11]|nr:CpXC domain-containing protein [Ruminococcaceae bacterium OttesenSCG-928-A11]
MKPRRIETACLQCAEPFTYDAVSYVNLNKRELREAFFDNSMFLISCPHCEAKFYHFIDTLLIDNVKRFLIYYDGEVSGVDTLCEYLKLTKDFEPKRKKYFPELSGNNANLFMDLLILTIQNERYRRIEDYVFEKFKDGFLVEYTDRLIVAKEYAIAHDMGIGSGEVHELRIRAHELHTGKRTGGFDSGVFHYSFLGSKDKEQFAFVTRSGENLAFPKADFEQTLKEARQNKESMRSFREDKGLEFINRALIYMQTREAAMSQPSNIKIDEEIIKKKFSDVVYLERFDEDLEDTYE